MDLRRFHDLVATLAVPDSRRRVLTRLAALALAGGLVDLRDAGEATARRRGRRRKTQHQHGKHRRHKQRKPRQCQAASIRETCAGRCGSVLNACEQAINCGACPCASACGACFVCDDATGACVADPTQEGDPCGAPGQVCQPDGSCACAPGSCGPCETCQGNGRCSLPCAGAGCCDANGACHGGDSVDFCGKAGEACIACDGEEICRADGQGETCRLNQAPDAFNLTVNDDWGKACVAVTLRGEDPDGDALAFQVRSKPINGRLFVYDENAPDFLGGEVEPGDAPVPAEAGTNELRLCYKTNNRFFFGQDSFRYVAIDTHGAASPVTTNPPSPLIQINIFET